jgi:hypothetical protein
MFQKTTVPDPQREALWRQRLAAQSASGMSITQWCRRSGTSASLFHYWKRALAKRDGRRLKPPRCPAAAENETQTQDVAFARVVIASPTPKAQFTASAADPAIQIVLSGLRVVRVGAGFDEATLARVLAVLEERSC